MGDGEELEFGGEDRPKRNIAGEVFESEKSQSRYADTRWDSNRAKPAPGSEVPVILVK